MSYSHATEIASQRYGPNTAALRLAEGWCPIAGHPKLAAPDRLHGGSAPTYCRACNVEWIITGYDMEADTRNIVICQAVEFVKSECVTCFARSVLTWEMLTDTALSIIDDVLRDTANVQRRRLAKAVYERHSVDADD